MPGEYASLPQDEQPDAPLEKDTSSAAPSLLTRAATLIAILCALADALLPLHLATRYLTPTPAPALAALPVVPPFPGFETLHPTATLRPITNYGRAFFQASSAEPAKIFPQWTESWISSDGVIPLDDRRLLVSPQISTIAQFRARDYGMETCRLALRMPSAKATKTPAHIANGTADLDVWLLAAPRRIKFQTLNWHNKPARKEYMGTLTAAYGSKAQTRAFECQSGAYVTVEVACKEGVGEAGCFVDVDVLGARSLGLYMQQYQTV